MERNFPDSEKIFLNLAWISDVAKGFFHSKFYLRPKFTIFSVPFKAIKSDVAHITEQMSSLRSQLDRTPSPSEEAYLERIRSFYDESSEKLEALSVEYSFEKNF